MYRMEKSERDPLPCIGRPVKEAESATDSARRMAAAYSLMPPGGPCAVPVLDGIPNEYRLVDGVELAATLAKTLVSTGLATPEQWRHADGDPFRFIDRALKDRIAANGGCELEKEFFLRLGLTSTLDPYGNDAEHVGDACEMFLVLEPDSAGYVVMGPALSLLGKAHPRLPATFFDLFTGSLNRWVRVYDYRDALERVEMLREWYEADPEGETVELPAVEAAVPACLRRAGHSLKERFLRRLIPRVHNKRARALIADVVELSRMSRQGKRPDVGEPAEAQLADSNPPVPALVAVFNRHDAIEGCFDARLSRISSFRSAGMTKEAFARPCGCWASCAPSFGRPRA
jgi:hypothetical protein